MNSAIEEVARVSDPIDNEFAAVVAGNANWSTARVEHISDLLTDAQERLTKELA